MDDVWSKCAVFVINLDRSPDRLATIHAHLSGAAIPYTRISGFDASKEDTRDCPIDLKSFQLTHGRKQIRKGEIGVYQSHLKAISAFLDSDKEFGIIFEDDAAPKPHFATVIERLIKWKDKWDIVPLFHFHSGGQVGIEKDGYTKLTVHLGHISSAAAYMINRHAARQLLQHLAVQRACLDHTLFAKWIHSLRIRGVVPMPVSLASHADVSTINAETSDKPHVLQRLPTFALRFYNTLRNFFTSVRELIRYKLTSR